MNLIISKMNKEDVGLAWDFCVSPQSCGNPEHYEEYLRLVAIGDNEQGKSTTHLLKNDNGEILGFLTLKAACVIFQTGDYLEGYAAMEISELAIHSDHEGRGCGSELILWAINKAVELNRQYLGIGYLTLCADPRATGFYEKLGFSKVTDSYELPRDGWNQNCVAMMMKLT